MNSYRIGFVFLTLAAANVKSECSLTINDDLNEPQVLILKKNKATDVLNAFHYPNSDGVIKFKKGQTALIECPGSSIQLSGKSISSPSKVIKCVDGKTFSMDAIPFVFKSMNCTKNTQNIAEYTGAKCLNKYDEVRIGFKLSDRRFITHIEVCFDKSLQTTYYAKCDLISVIEAYQRNYPRVLFDDSGLFTSKIKDVYVKNNQREMINSLLGLDKNSEDVIHKSDDYYLAAGHLTAKTDLVYGAQQLLTFYYINAVPQWQTNNGGNWYSLESTVRNYASDSGKNFVIYTGTHDVCQLPHSKTQALVPIYLDRVEKELTVPVPKLLWKIIYDPVTKAGIAFITHNNPYDKSEIKVCTDICNLVSGLRWKSKDIKSGYSYCCEVNDLRKTVKTIPDFEVTSVLR